MALVEVIGVDDVKEEAFEDGEMDDDMVGEALKLLESRLEFALMLVDIRLEELIELNKLVVRLVPSEVVFPSIDEVSTLGVELGLGVEMELLRLIMLDVVTGIVVIPELTLLGSERIEVVEEAEAERAELTLRLEQLPLWYKTVAKLPAQASPGELVQAVKQLLSSNFGTDVTRLPQKHKLP